MRTHSFQMVNNPFFKGQEKYAHFENAVLYATASVWKVQVQYIYSLQFLQSKLFISTGNMKRKKITFQFECWIYGRK